MRTVHVVAPAGLDDPTRPSGGNRYDRRVCDELVALGWTVFERHAGGAWPQPAPSDLTALGRLLGRIPDDALVLIDGLIASAAPDPLRRERDRLRLIVLVHLPLGTGRAPGHADHAAHAAHAGEATVLALARAVVTTSEWTRQVLLSGYPLDPALVHVATPGVDPAPTARGTATGGELLCVAAVVHHKGHDLLLAALATLADRPWRLTCVGALDLEPGFVEWLRTQAERSGIADRVVFLGARTGTALEAAYSRADLLVSPSRGETYAMTVTEALAHGLPVIASDVGGLSEALGRTALGVLPGLLVPPEDAMALAGALASWLDDGDLRDGLRSAAGQRRESLTDWTLTADLVSQVLARVA